MATAMHVPSLPASLTLHTKTRPQIPSLLSIPASPSVPRSPLFLAQAPPRLAARAFAKSPVLSPQKFSSSPPPTPYPWIWRCHLCHSVYRLGVTRRCLEDGHYFCSLPSPPPSPSPVFNAALSSLLPPKKKKSQAPRGCRAEFDYAGWASYNMWRREQRFIKKAHAEAADAGKTMVDVKNKARQQALQDDEHRHSISSPTHNHGPDKDCYRDCDFPSECHTYLRLQQQALARAKRAKRNVNQTSALSNLLASATDDFTPANVAVEGEIGIALQSALSYDGLEDWESGSASSGSPSSTISASPSPPSPLAVEIDPDEHDRLQDDLDIDLDGDDMMTTALASSLSYTGEDGTEFMARRRRLSDALREMELVAEAAQDATYHGQSSALLMGQPQMTSSVMDMEMDLDEDPSLSSGSSTCSPSPTSSASLSPDEMSLASSASTYSTSSSAYSRHRSKRHHRMETESVTTVGSACSTPGSGMFSAAGMRRACDDKDCDHEGGKDASRHQSPESSELTQRRKRSLAKMRQLTDAILADDGEGDDEGDVGLAGMQRQDHGCAALQDTLVDTAGSDLRGVGCGLGISMRTETPSTSTAKHPTSAPSSRPLYAAPQSGQPTLSTTVVHAHAHLLPLTFTTITTTTTAAAQPREKDLGDVPGSPLKREVVFDTATTETDLGAAWLRGGGAAATNGRDGVGLNDVNMGLDE